MKLSKEKLESMLAYNARGDAAGYVTTMADLPIQKYLIQSTLERDLLLEVAQCAQEALDGLDVGFVQSESPIHKELREAMIEYREKKEALTDGKGGE